MGMKSSDTLRDTLFGVNDNEGFAHAAAPKVANGLGDFTLNPANFYTAAKVFVEALTRDTESDEAQLITYATDNMHVWMQNKIIEKINNGDSTLNSDGKFEGGLWYDDYGVSTVYRATAPAQLKTADDWTTYLGATMTDGWAWAVTLGRATWEVDPSTGEVTWTGGTAYDFDPKTSFPEWFTEWFDNGDPKNIAQYKPQIFVDPNLITRSIQYGTDGEVWEELGLPTSLFVWCELGTDGSILANLTQLDRTSGGGFANISTQIHCGIPSWDILAHGETKSISSSSELEFGGSFNGTISSDESGHITYNGTVSWPDQGDSLWNTGIDNQYGYPDNQCATLSSGSTSVTFGWNSMSGSASITWSDCVD